MSPSELGRPTLFPRVRVGVTGHRTLADPAAVAAAVDRALARIVAEYPGRRLTVMSALAEGADRLVAERALAFPESLLVALLPLPEDTYLETFAGDASREAFGRLRARAEGWIVIPSTGSVEEGFEDHGEWLIRLSSVLLAVWDGEPARGLGGTARVVERARRDGAPLAWIRAERAGGARGAELVWERFPDPVAAG